MKDDFPFEAIWLLLSAYYMLGTAWRSLCVSIS